MRISHCGRREREHSHGFGAGGPGAAGTGVGAILRFFTVFSSGSDSLTPPASLFPKVLPFMELAGVIGGVVKGTPAGPELVAVTLGTVPIVGVGELPIIGLLMN